MLGEPRLCCNFMSTYSVLFSKKTEMPLLCNGVDKRWTWERSGVQESWGGPWASSLVSTFQLCQSCLA